MSNHTWQIVLMGFFFLSLDGDTTVFLTVKKLLAVNDDGDGNGGSAV